MGLKGKVDPGKMADTDLILPGQVKRQGDNLTKRLPTEGVSGGFDFKVKLTGQAVIKSSILPTVSGPITQLLVELYR